MAVGDVRTHEVTFCSRVSKWAENLFSQNPSWGFVRAEIEESVQRKRSDLRFYRQKIAWCWWVKPKLLLCLTLVLSGFMFGCSTAAQQQRTELTWPDAAADFWIPSIVSERFNHAATKMLGSESDIAAVQQSIAADQPRQNLNITDLRWLLPTLVMARVRGMETGYIYVVEKKNGQWTVIVHYVQWRS